MAEQPGAMLFLIGLAFSILFVVIGTAASLAFLCTLCLALIQSGYRFCGNKKSRDWTRQWVTPLFRFSAVSLGILVAILFLLWLIFIILAWVSSLKLPLF